VIKRFKTWWNAERVGRFEEGTSQDMCPTNGGVVTFAVLWGGMWLVVAVAMCIRLRAS